MSGWGDLFNDKYDQVLDESTGQYIMVDKSAPKYKLDAKGNIINPPPKADAPAPAAAGSSGIFGFGGAAPAGGGGSGGGFVFGGTEAPAATSGGGGGFVFGGGSAAPAAAGGGGGGGGFVFGGTPAPAGGGFAFGGANAAQAAAAGGGGGFVFGKSAEGSATAAGGGVEKRRADTAGDRRTEPKRRRTRDLRLTGDESGTVLVVGNGDCGQLGLGDEDDDVRDTLKPAPMPALDSKRICQIVCGGLHTAALGLDGRLFTWGCNDDEVLGRGGDESSPGVVEGGLLGKRVVLVTAGDSHMAALTSEGQIYSWGTYKDSNGYIMHGYKDKEGALSEKARDRARPSLVPNLPKMRYVASGADHTLGLADDGFSIFGWGCGEKGQLGRELEWEKHTKEAYLVPTQSFCLRLPDDGATSSVKGRLTRVLNENFLTWLRTQLDSDAAMDCAEGCEAYLDHAADLEAKTTGALDDRLPIASLHCGAYHSFARTTHGNVYAFGLNNMGQLGLGSLEPNSTGEPTLVTALEGKRIQTLIGGEHHSLALSEEGEVYAFGRGDNNQLGFDDGTDQQLTPKLVDGLRGITVRRIATQANSNAAVSRSGDLYMWGFGEMGQLCNGRTGDEASPALVESAGVAGKAVLDAACGGQHSVIVAMERPD